MYLKGGLVMFLDTVIKLSPADENFVLISAGVSILFIVVVAVYVFHSFW